MKLTRILTLTFYILLFFIVLGRSFLSAGNKVTLRNRYLLLDNRIIESTRNAVLHVGTAKKSPSNPLFVEEFPWEPRFDNLYPNAIYDKEEKLFKCWYSPFIICESTTNTPRDQRKKFRYMGPHTGHRREMGICYAVSRDGITWKKPLMDIITWNGKKTNILCRGPHGAGIFKDEHDLDPKRRYKAFFKGKGMSVMFSADGIHWGKPIPCPGIDAAGDTHNNAFWSPDQKGYIGITRLWKGARQVGWTKSRDFLNWSKAKAVLEGTDRHLQTYAMPVFRHGGVYLGMLAIFNTREDRTHNELAWSPDTITWHRIEPGTSLIPNAPKKGDYDWGCVYASAPVFLDNEIRLYYGGSNGPHSGWRDGSFCLATLRPDGFAGYVPADSTRPATITTRPVTWKGDLKVTADIAKGGSLKVTLIIGNRKKAISKPVTGNVTDFKLSWIKNSNDYKFRFLRSSTDTNANSLRSSTDTNANFLRSSTDTNANSLRSAATPRMASLPPRMASLPVPLLTQAGKHSAGLHTNAAGTASFSTKKGTSHGIKLPQKNERVRIIFEFNRAILYSFCF